MRLSAGLALTGALALLLVQPKPTVTPRPARQPGTPAEALSP